MAIISIVFIYKNTALKQLLINLIECNIFIRIYINASLVDMKKLILILLITICTYAQSSPTLMETCSNGETPTYECLSNVLVRARKDLNTEFNKLINSDTESRVVSARRKAQSDWEKYVKSDCSISSVGYGGKGGNGGAAEMTYCETMRVMERVYVLKEKNEES